MPFKCNLQRYTADPEEITEILGETANLVAAAETPAAVWPFKPLRAAEVLTGLSAPRGGALHVGIKLTHNP